MTNLKPIHECNAREVEMMVGKAMCAWANAEANRKFWEAEENASLKRGIQVEVEKAMSEYEATVRCIAMFVSDTLPAICKHVIDRAETELLAA